MHGSLTVQLSTIFSFLLVLARVAGIFTFIPIPGVGGVLAPARIMLTLAITLSLFPLWRSVAHAPVNAGQIAVWLLSEAALGVSAGIVVALVMEVFLIAGQIAGMQAGYSYASMIDPATQADSGILVVLAQIGTGMLFFAAGLDRRIIRIMAHSLETVPPGTFTIGLPSAQAVIGLGAETLATGFKLALPVVALLVMIDLALALAGRLNAQLQLISVAFPAKMLAAIAVLSIVSVVYPRVFARTAAVMMRTLEVMVTR